MFYLSFQEIMIQEDEISFPKNLVLEDAIAIGNQVPTVKKLHLKYQLTK